MKKTIICLIISIVMLSLIFIYFNFLTNAGIEIKVTDIKIGKTYIVKQGKKVSGVKIISIEETKVVVEHIGTITDCEYNKEYKFWPDSQDGKIMWQAPQAILVFEKY